MALWSEKKMKELNEQERCLLRAYGIMRERANYYRLGNTEKDIAVAIAYESASDLLRYGADMNWECLNQFDYFNN